MNYPTHDTDWAISSKGNHWKRKDGVLLVVGKRKDARYWARRGDDFISGSFPTLSEAKRAAEYKHAGEDTSNVDDDSWC
jgi:hypothetical protein